MNRSLAIAHLEVSTYHPVCHIQIVTAQTVYGRRDSLATTHTLFLNTVALKRFSENVLPNLSSSDPLGREWGGAARLKQVLGKGLVGRCGSARDGEGSDPTGTPGCEVT